MHRQVRRSVRRFSVTLTAALVAVGATTGSALAFQPPAEAAAGNFGCVTDEDGAIIGSDPVDGHPGSAGLGREGPSFNRAATPHGDGPTAWNAVHKPNPIVAGSCEEWQG